MGSDSAAKAAGVAEGASIWKAAYGINLHKLMCGFVIYGFMHRYSCFTPLAWTYLSLHTSYGLLWIVKDLIFPDKSFQNPCLFGEMAGAFIFCSVAYLPYGWLLVSNGGVAPPWCSPLAMVLFCLGMFLMHGADCQKYYTLKASPGKLIIDGFFKYVRNPNYLGELIIYVSFSLLTGNAWSAVLTFLAVASVWIPNMIKKDRSMSRYSEFSEWKKRTYILLPPLF